MLIVQKYGGSSLADETRVRAAARRIAGLARQGNQLLVVVSAQADTTDLLTEKARRINPRGSLREMDACLATAEVLSASLMAMAIGELGCDAVSLSGQQAGIHTDRNHGNARIRRIDTTRIRRELGQGKVVVVAGFQGIHEADDVTTLGRGGSDTTAVALAGALSADACQIFTDVDGIYDRDPRRYPDAIRFGRIGYDHMLRLVRSGAQVLHEPCVELAKQQGITIEVLSSFTGAPGTLVTGDDLELL